MPSVQRMIAAMDAVSLELATHFTHLAIFDLIACQNETIGSYVPQRAWLEALP